MSDVMSDAVSTEALPVEALPNEVTSNMVITESAQVYLRELLGKQNSPGIGVGIFVKNPGTPLAECRMAY